MTNLELKLATIVLLLASGCVNRSITILESEEGQHGPPRDSPVVSAGNWDVPPQELRFLDARPADCAGCYADTSYPTQLRLDIGGFATACQWDRRVRDWQCASGTWNLAEGGVVRLILSESPDWARKSGLLEPLYAHFYYAALVLSNSRIGFSFTPSCERPVPSGHCGMEVLHPVAE